MKRKTLSMLLASAGVAILVFAPTVFAIDTENQKQDDLSSYSVRVHGKRKNHCTTIGLKEPESVTCPSCGTQTTDNTRSYTLPDGFEEVPVIATDMARIFCITMWTATRQCAMIVHQWKIQMYWRIRLFALSRSVP